MSPERHAAAQALIATARRMAVAGLNHGTAGNLSCRLRLDGADGYLITPTGMDYARLSPPDIPWLGLDGGRQGGRQPSSEWRLHQGLYATRPEVGAVLHAHAPFAVSLACLRRDIPPFHYMIARFGGDTVRCSAYALFGSQALADAACLALADRKACLLANHGFLVCGCDLDEAFCLGEALENLCEHYWRASLLGAPVLLDAAEMAAVQARFATYGQQQDASAEIVPPAG
jgi:L-fuculose-phosphate aldolase